MLILGIKSSCDDAAAAVIETSRPDFVLIRSSIIANQDEIHRRYGGVVPAELVWRNHVVTILPVIEQALEAAGCALGDLGGIAVTRGPGLVGSLLLGLTRARDWRKVSIPGTAVNHIEGHLLAPLLEHRLAMPFLALVVSGGHTELFVVEDFGHYRRLGRTRDDAAGEAFDKVAKLMGLGYPGGRVIDELARRGNRRQVRISRAHVRGAPLDFSFSGVKTAIATLLRTEAGAALAPWDLAASFQEAVVDTEGPAMHAARETGIEVIALTGGVAANSRLRERLAEAGGRGRRLQSRCAVAQVLHRQRGDDRDGWELSAFARGTRLARRRRRRDADLVGGTRRWRCHG